MLPDAVTGANVAASTTGSGGDASSLRGTTDSRINNLLPSV